MLDCAYLAYRYLTRRPWVTGLLILAMALTAYFPLTVQWVLADMERALLDRAQATPLTLGAKGSRNDLALHALYFGQSVAETTTYAQFESVTQSGRAAAYPLLVTHTAKGYPVVGTTLEYLEFRDLGLHRGRSFRQLGECVLGSAVARKLGLEPGSSVISDAADGFGLTGDYPLKLAVTGVLETSGSPDDDAVFVDVKTAWVMEGIGHGHEDLDAQTDAEVLLEREGGALVANASLREYTEITQQNIDRFHFHGESANYPLTAIIVEPGSSKDEAILRGQYLRSDADVVLLRSKEVIEELLGVILDVKALFDRYSIATALVSVLLMGVIMALSVRMRRRELLTMGYIGCSPRRQLGVIMWEIGLIAGAASAMAGSGVVWTVWNRDWLARLLF